MKKAMMEMYVYIPENVYYSIIDGKAIISLPCENAIYTLDPVGTRIWDLADGSLKIKRIVDIICKEFDVDRDTAIKDIMEFIENLSKQNILQLTKVKKINRAKWIKMKY